MTDLQVDRIVAHVDFLAMIVALFGLLVVVGLCSIAKGNR